MNKLIVALVLILGMIACSNDFELLAPQKDIPIVYGLLSPSDTAQYIRVERAFIDESTPANELAQRADLLYYDNATVQLIRNSNGQTYTLDRVDGNLEGYTRAEGIFATAPNYLYKINSEDIILQEEEAYTFQLSRDDHSEVVTAETVIVESPTIIRPTATSKLDFDFIDNFEVRWRANEGAQVFDVILRVHFVEKVGSDPSIDRFVDWRMGANIEGEELVKPGIEFYSFMASALDANPDVTRGLRSFEVKVLGGGQEILDFVRIGQANLGISSSQEIPTYSNLSEGVGVFSSRGISSRLGLGFTPRTLDSLRTSQITKDLNFR